MTAERIGAALRDLPRVDLVHLTHFSRLGLGFLGHSLLRQRPAIATLTDYTNVCGDFQLIHRRSGQPCVPPVAAELCAACLNDRSPTTPQAHEVEAWRRRNLAVPNERCHGVWAQTPYQDGLLVRRRLRPVLDAGLGLIAISVDGADGTGARVSAAVTLSTRNIATFSAIVSYVADLGLREITVESLHQWGHDQRLNAESLFALDPVEPVCPWPWDGLSVTRDGDVTPCCVHIEADERSRVGNVHEAGIDDIWTGHRLEILRGLLRRGTGWSSCNGCVYRKELGRAR